MSARDKKIALLHQLSQEPEPIPLQALMRKLGPDFAERTVRRWLHEMVQEGQLQRIGTKRATKYLIQKLTERPATETNTLFGRESLAALENVHLPLYLRPPTTYDDALLEAYIPNTTFYLSANFRQALHNAGKRATREDPAGTYAHKIFNRLLIDLSFNSSRLEGNTYSLLDTQRLLLEGVSPEGKLEEEKIMILNHKEAIRYLVDNAPRIQINDELIYTLHYLLAESLVESKYAGKIRDHGVRIGGSTYVPYENPEKLKLLLNRITNKAQQIEDPYEQSVFLLIHISYLQAFTDVNKRTARLSANIPLIIHNLVPLSFNDVRKADYTSAVIAVYELKDMRPLVELYMFSYMRTCALYDAAVQSIGFDEVRVRYRQQRRMLLREIILEQMVGEPLERYISAKAYSLVPENERDAFIHDVEEDLELMDNSRIAGLGVDQFELQKWLVLYRASH